MRFSESLRETKDRGSEAARQMAVAYRHYREPPYRLNWDYVIERRKALWYDSGRQIAR